MRAYIRSVPRTVCPFAAPVSESILIVEVDGHIPEGMILRWLAVIDWDMDPVLIFICPDVSPQGRDAAAVLLAEHYPALEFFSSREDDTTSWRRNVPPHIQVNTRKSLARAREVFP